MSKVSSGSMVPPIPSPSQFKKGLNQAFYRYGILDFNTIGVTIIGVRAYYRHWLRDWKHNWDCPFLSDPLSIVDSLAFASAGGELF